MFAQFFGLCPILPARPSMPSWPGLTRPSTPSRSTNVEHRDTGCEFGGSTNPWMAGSSPAMTQYPAAPFPQWQV
jgi:hypothetical protein